MNSTPIKIQPHNLKGKGLQVGQLEGFRPEEKAIICQFLIMQPIEKPRKLRRIETHATTKNFIFLPEIQWKKSSNILYSYLSKEAIIVRNEVLHISRLLEGPITISKLQTIGKCIREDPTTIKPKTILQRAWAYLQVRKRWLTNSTSLENREQPFTTCTSKSSVRIPPW